LLCSPHRAEAFPAAVRELLQHHQHRATNLLRLATRRVDNRSRERTPLDGPATIQKSEVLGFRNVAQHLENFVSGLPFVARSDNLLADFPWLAYAYTNSVISPHIRQRDRIARQRGGNVLLAELLDGGQVCSAPGVPSGRRATFLATVQRQDRKRGQTNNN